MKGVVWYLKQMFPLTYRSQYVTCGDGRKHFCVWKMWFGHCYKIDDVVIL